MIAATVDWKVITVAAVLLLVAMVLLYRLTSRDPNVRSTKFGFYVERARYDDEPSWQPSPWPEPPIEEQTLPWPAVPPKEDK